MLNPFNVMEASVFTLVNCGELQTQGRFRSKGPHPAIRSSCQIVHCVIRKKGKYNLAMSRY